jgi:PEP-CTERM motif-containing protein
MAMPRAGILVAAIAGALALASPPAQAGLVGATVDVLSWSPDLTTNLGAIPQNPTHFTAAPQTIPNPQLVFLGDGSAAANPVASLDGITVTLTNTQIIITNLFAGVPFCLNPTAGGGCSDSFDGLEFRFTGVDITSVGVNAATAADFRPAGAQPNPKLASSSDLLVNFLNDSPNVNDQLVLDLSFAATTSVPEPGSLALLATGLLGWGAIRRRARKGRRPDK